MLIKLKVDQNMVDTMKDAMKDDKHLLALLIVFFVIMAFIAAFFGLADIIGFKDIVMMIVGALIAIIRRKKDKDSDG